MIILIIIFAALVLAVAIIALAAVRRVDRGPRNTGFQADPDAAKQWAEIAGRHDAERGYEERAMSSEGYRYIRDLRDKIRDGLPSTTAVHTALKGLEAYKAFSADTYLRRELDKDDLKGLVLASDACIAEWGLRRDEIDKACTIASDCEDAEEKRQCLKLVDEIFYLLCRDARVTYTCPPVDGRHFRNTVTVKRADLLEMAGMPPEGAPDIKDDPEERRKLLARDGFRCVRCGRSPISGGRLVLAWIEAKRDYETICDMCGHERPAGRGPA